MPGKIIVVGPKDKRPSPKGDITYNVTTKSKDDGKALSPFLLGPVPLYWGLTAKKVENAWQFSKVYREQILSKMEYDLRGENGRRIATPNASWWEWALKGFDDNWAHRYPMGKGAKPVFSFWRGEHLDYIEARKRIYLPLYARCAQNTLIFNHIYKEYEAGKEIILWDFDGYNYESLEMTLEEVLNEPKKIMGHAHVLAMMIENPSLIPSPEEKW